MPQPVAPPAIHFKHSWRPYQEEILRDFKVHAGDRHFHIVAPPGSGKTVLGIELLRLLEKPALILAPTLVVREQWIERLLRDFLPDSTDRSEPAWISRDPRSPGCLTFSTYQSLAVIYKREEQKELLDILKDAGVTVLVVDEAHHLRAFWWKCLRNLKEELGSPTVVALTATPPYDVPQSEWNRYSSFCGEVDAEITAPELVAAGSLCPHQDLVHFSVPLPDEAAALADHHFLIDRLFRDFCLDSALASKLYDLPFFAKIEDSTLLESLDFCIAAAIYFSETHGKIPPALWNALEIEDVTLPPFDLRWLAALLTGIYFGPGEESELEELKIWRQRLHEAGVIHKRQILFEPPEAREKALAGSVRKLNAITGILDHEAAALGDKLRAVVLCDHIRERDFPSGLGPAAERDFVRLGVVPAFESVRRLRLPGVRPAILTGTLIAIPTGCRDDFLEGCASTGVDAAGIIFTPFIHDPTFLRLGFPQSHRHAAVGIMTRLFENGRINALFGTASLLGEGWDAPAVNTLVIASTIGTHVMSNQMRGRAIRTWHRDPYKTANIWHLTTISDHDRDGPTSDLGKLRRRFEVFAGLNAPADNERPIVGQGLARLGIGSTLEEAEVAGINASMFNRAEERDTNRHHWSLAVMGNKTLRLRPIREVAVSSRKIESKFIARIGNSGFLGGLHQWLVLRRMRKIAGVVLEALQSSGEISGTVSAGCLACEINEARCHIGLTGTSAREQAVFSRAMLELFDPFIARPRYLIVTSKEIYCIPALFGGNAAAAERFSTLWSSRVGSHILHYHDTAPGRRELVRIREQALLCYHGEPPGVTTRWRETPLQSD